MDEPRYGSRRVRPLVLRPPVDRATVRIAPHDRPADSERHADPQLHTRSRRVPARLAARAVWSVWFAMLVAAFAYVCFYGTEMPFTDDLSQAHAVAPEFHVDWAWLWQPHNEHHIPLARLVHHASIELTRDFRAGTILEVALLGALAAALIRTAQRLRGRASFADAFFPLILLHVGNFENLLNSFQLTFTLPTALLGLALCFVATSEDRLDRRVVLGAGVPAVLLSTCSLVGLVWSGPLALWLAWQAARAVRGRIVRERAALPIACACLLATAAVWMYCVVVDWHSLPVPRKSTPWDIVRTAWQYCGQAAGTRSVEWSPWSGTIALAAVVYAVAITWRAWRRGAPSLAHTGIVACLLAHVAVALTLGWGRGMDQVGAGYLNRYTELSALGLCSAYVATLRAGTSHPGVARGVVHLRPSSRASSVFQALACVAALAIAIGNVRPGIEAGRARRADVALLEADLARGMPIEHVARKHLIRFFYSVDWFIEALECMQRAELGPFSSGRAAFTKDRVVSSGLQPIEMASSEPILSHLVVGHEALIVFPEARLVYALPKSATHVYGSFGIHPRAWRLDSCRGARFVVSLERPNGSSEVKIDRELVRDREGETAGPHPFDLHFAAGEFQYLTLRASHLAGAAPAKEWTYFGVLSAD